ncbi:calcium-dependent protein kinase 5-like [Hylaeus volcanicus]|uniref:calcium-dependent protein kinase 5-like n=1 Tax=Hylaeus volcanicus TaxID=313075 RepID=UPI0023B81D2C|nr:calcium-dependent protein kinase 5-like [Hylaeus volcanicus]
MNMKKTKTSISGPHHIETHEYTNHPTTHLSSKQNLFMETCTLTNPLTQIDVEVTPPTPCDTDSHVLDDLSICHKIVDHDESVYSKKHLQSGHQNHFTHQKQNKNQQNASTVYPTIMSPFIKNKNNYIIPVTPCVNPVALQDKHCNRLIQSQKSKLCKNCTSKKNDHNKNEKSFSCTLDEEKETKESDDTAIDKTSIHCEEILKQKSNNERLLEKTYIIASKSFKEASKRFCESRQMYRLSQSNASEFTSRAYNRAYKSRKVQEKNTFFHRFSFVKHEIITGGASFSDYYDLNVKSLGKGSFGSVVGARDLRTGSLRAVKIVYKPKVANVTRLKREILIMKALDHPNIIRLFEVFEDTKNLYLVMEICLGGELFDRIIKLGHFPERYAALVLKQILSAISYCHANDIIHRDLKPENVLFNETSSSSLKVIDWGFAAKCIETQKCCSLVGTPYYVAPEILLGSYDRQCDVWSAGVIFYILLCGYPPFYGKNNNEILKKIKEAHISFDSRYWNTISEDAKNLLRGLLKYDSKRRLTAAQALQHPWIQYHTRSLLGFDATLSNKLGEYLIHKFKAFLEHNKFKKLTLTVIAFQMNKKNISKLHDIFSVLDRDADGVLSNTELSMGLSRMNVQYSDFLGKIFHEIDTDGNGTIDYTEFIAASLDYRFYEQEVVCREAFHVLDLNGDGKISINEIRHLLQINSRNSTHFDRTLHEMINEVDVNQDGYIDFHEFMEMMRKENTQKSGKNQNKLFF